MRKKILDMKIKYNKETDILRIRFNENPILESDEQKDGLIIDYDLDGNMAGIELLSASKKV